MAENQGEDLLVTSATDTPVTDNPLFEPEVIEPEPEGNSIPIVPVETEKKSETESAPEEVKKEETPVKEEIPQSEWQDMKDKVKASDEFRETLAQSLGINKEEVKEEDVMKAMQEKQDSLEQDLARVKWEKSHPEIPAIENENLSEEDKDLAKVWDDACKNKKKPDHKYHDLTYDEVWKLVEPPKKPKILEKQLKDQEVNIGSIPVSGKSSVQKEEEIDPDMMKILRQIHNTKTDKEILSV